MQQIQANLWNIAGVNMAPHYLTTSDAHTLAPTSLQLLQQLQATTSAATPVAAGAGANALSSVQHQLLLQQHLGLGAATPAHAAPPAVPSPPEISPANLQGLATLASLGNSAANAGVSPMSMQNLVTLAAMTGGNGNLQVSPTSEYNRILREMIACALLKNFYYPLEIKNDWTMLSIVICFSSWKTNDCMYSSFDSKEKNTIRNET